MKTKKKNKFGGDPVAQRKMSAKTNSKAPTWVKGNNRTGAEVVKGVKKRVQQTKIENGKSNENKAKEKAEEEKKKAEEEKKKAEEEKKKAEEDKKKAEEEKKKAEEEKKKAEEEKKKAEEEKKKAEEEKKKADEQKSQNQSTTQNTSKNNSSQQKSNASGNSSGSSSGNSTGNSGADLIKSLQPSIDKYLDILKQSLPKPESTEVPSPKPSKPIPADSPFLKLSFPVSKNNVSITNLKKKVKEELIMRELPEDSILAITDESTNTSPSPKSGGYRTKKKIGGRLTLTARLSKKTNPTIINKITNSLKKNPLEMHNKRGRIIRSQNVQGNSQASSKTTFTAKFGDVNKSDLIKAAININMDPVVIENKKSHLHQSFNTDLDMKTDEGSLLQTKLQLEKLSKDFEEFTKTGFKPKKLKPMPYVGPNPEILAEENKSCGWLPYNDDNIWVRCNSGPDKLLVCLDEFDNNLNDFYHEHNSKNIKGICKRIPSFELFNQTPNWVKDLNI